MTVPVWVIDTNVLVSAALTAGGNCDRIMRAAVEGRIRLAWSPPMLAEYRTVLMRPKFKLSPLVVANLLNCFGPSDQILPLDAPDLPDPDDTVFLGTALATADKVLVTGNTAHFPEEICRPARIMTPVEAVQAI
ncbi:MAG: putative toxin-antitoxin system toxin component, PIN family [Opitutales bacterium]|nr:putative toxin-antitoxin system toxin component, PIN family [Opitutales bacterium]